MKFFRPMVAALLMAGLTSPASAALVTRTFVFSAVGPFSAALGGTAPTSPVNGSITVSFDDAATVLDQLGVAVNYIDVAYQNNVRYSYYAGFDGGTLAFSSANYSPSLGSVNVNGFALTINNVGSANLPLRGTFNYSMAGWNDRASTRTVLFEAAAPSGAVPEPATWAMMIAGFGMTGAALRRRRTLVARFA